MLFGLMCGIITIYINKNIDDEVQETIGYGASGLLIIGSIINSPIMIIVGTVLETSIIINSNILNNFCKITYK